MVGKGDFKKNLLPLFSNNNHVKFKLEIYKNFRMGIALGKVLNNVACGNLFETSGKKLVF